MLSLSQDRLILEILAAIALEVTMAFIWLPTALTIDNAKRFITPVSSIWLSALASSKLLVPEGFYSCHQQQTLKISHFTY